MSLKMWSKFTIGFLLSTCVASCLGLCQLEVGGSPQSYICEALTDLAGLSTIPETAQKITIFNSKIKLIPGNIFSRFGNTLTYLNITNSEVSDIEPGAFSGLPALRDLILDHNDIKVIKTDWVKGLENLKTLRIWHNHITSIEPEVFSHLSDLELLDIAYNNIDYCLSIESLHKLESLDIIYLTGNPWPLRCRPPVIFHLENKHVQVVSDWGDSHLLIEECLAHELHAQYNDVILGKCLASLRATLQVPSTTNPQL